MVMMTRIEERGVAFVHASDIQFLEEATIEKILDWEPDIVLASGPPLYHYSSSSFQKQRERAWKNALKLTQNVKTLIVDHHLLRSQEGIEWLEDLKRRSNHNILCGAEFMGMQPLFLEAWREELYGWLPVPEGWHANYKKSRVSADSYRLKGWEALIKNKKITPCKWYYCCPIKGYTEKGKLDRYWIENYCLVNNHNCVRYQMEERGEYHPDNMLPNGEIKKDL
jgi:hypothetical protein